jgi:hypothetical protein
MSNCRLCFAFTLFAVGVDLAGQTLHAKAPKVNARDS